MAHNPAHLWRKMRRSTLRQPNAPNPRNDKSPCICKGLCQWLRRRAPRCQPAKRRGQDSNLRSSCPDTDLANPRFRPLSHLSGSMISGFFHATTYQQTWPLARIPIVLHKQSTCKVSSPGTTVPCYPQNRPLPTCTARHSHETETICLTHK